MLGQSHNPIMIDGSVLDQRQPTSSGTLEDVDLPQPSISFTDKIPVAMQQQSHQQLPSRGSQPTQHDTSDLMQLEECHNDQGVHFNIGGVVELSDGDFILIKTIAFDADGEPRICGWRFRRNNRSGGVLARHGRTLNEVFLELLVDENDSRHAFQQGLNEVSASLITRKRTLVVTNTWGDRFNFREHTDMSNLKSQDVREQGSLRCRWVAILHFRRPAERYKYLKCQDPRRPGCKPSMVTYRRIRTTDRALLGGYGRAVHFESELNLLLMHRDVPLRRQYTMADLCCGVGGVSEGARQQPELAVVLGIDISLEACVAYQSNHLVRCIPKHIADAIDELKGESEDHRVEIIHLSLPCQYYSAAHTKEGKNDEMNTASFLCVEEVLKFFQPRIVTFEETEGLKTHHPDWFNKALSMFTNCDYSVRAKSVHFDDFGHPHKRRRIILYAACPGEELPDFPAPTHGDGPGLLPRTTVRQALRQIHRDSPDHHPEPCDPVCAAPEAWDLPLNNAVTCGGTTNLHPDGRVYTVRELACLQGFPMHYEFNDRFAKMHIGNAVPPPIMKILFRPVIETLRRTDAKLAAAQQN